MRWLPLSPPQKLNHEATLCRCFVEPRMEERRQDGRCRPEYDKRTRVVPRDDDTMEGVTLLRSYRETLTGFRNVGFNVGARTKPYSAHVSRGGKQVNLGFFDTAEEAALCFARSPEGRAAAAASSEPAPLSAEEVQRIVAAEGLTTF